MAKRQRTNSDSYDPDENITLKQSCVYRLESLLRTVHDSERWEILEIRKSLDDQTDFEAVGKRLAELEAKQILPCNLRARFRQCYDTMRKLCMKIRGLKIDKEQEELDEEVKVVKYSSLISSFEFILEELLKQINQLNYDEDNYLDNLSMLLYFEESNKRMDQFIYKLVNHSKTYGLTN